MKNFGFKTFEEYKILPKEIKPAAGRVLLSEPFLKDYIFKRSAILLIEHNNEGSFGFILNKPLGIKITDVFDDFPYIDSEVFLGGPVNKNTLYYLHTLGNKLKGSHHVGGSVYFGGDLNDLKAMIASGEIKPEQIKFFLGYSGWGEGQLEKEMNEKSWVVSKMHNHLVLVKGVKRLWHEYLLKMGTYYAIWSRFPSDPSLN